VSKTCVQLRDRRRREGGLTLIETVCAAVVLALAILGLSRVALSANEMQQSGVQKAAALREVERQLATVQSSDFASIVATFDGTGFGVILDGAAAEALTAVPNDADGRPGLVTVTAPTGDPDALLEVQVRIDWLGRNGPQSVARTLRLSRVGSGT
jgi:hypothetical protein